MEEDIFRDAEKRAQVISVYKTMERLVEAVFVLVHQRQWNGASTSRNKKTESILGGSA
jgi:hypothetical protein